MKVVIITPIPELFKSFLDNTMVRKSISNKTVDISVVDLRKFGVGSYKKIDDSPYGGGEGMIMMAEPLGNAINYAMEIIGRGEDMQIIFPTPQGEELIQKEVLKLSKLKGLIIVCGHYKGIDERIIKKYITKEISVGNYVLSNGEIPAMIIIDSITRILPGTLNNLKSALTDTHPYGLYDHPHYTKPRVFEGMDVPKILLSGHHEKISEWRQKKREVRTKEKNPRLWIEYLKLEEKEFENG
jgi:tRNA (guanine37-N1)-methyltransferase